MCRLGSACSRSKSFHLGVGSFIAIFLCTIVSSDLTFDGRTYFYTRNVQDLEALTLKDLRAARYLQAIKSELRPTTKLRKLVDRYLADFVDSNGFEDMSDDQAVRMMGNPLSVYRLIRRFTNYLKAVVMEAGGDYGILPDGVHHIGSDYWPLYNDIRDAMEMILQIHTIMNDFDPSQFARGNIRGMNTSARLRAVHCFEIGVYAKSKRYFTLAVSWLETAVELQEEDDTIDAALIEAELLTTYELHDQAYDSRSVHDPYFFSQPQFTPIAGMDVESRPHRTVLYNSYFGQPYADKFWPANYWGMCSGVELMTDAEKAHLFCWLEYKIHHLYTIGPLRMEFLSRNPDIVQIHDVFTDRETEKLMAQGDKLMPSYFDDPSHPHSRKLEYSRTSSQQFLDDDGPGVLESPVGKAELITGLKIAKETASEKSQIAAYTVGGLYEVHVDALMDRKVYGNTGDRIATFMAYLNSVDLGGYTVFTAAKAIAKPQKGSAVLWFNLYSDGSTDSRTVHGACPVVMGTKWVATKWIRYNDQFLSRQCALKPKERIRIPVNGKYLPIPKVFARNDHVGETPSDQDPLLQNYVGGIIGKKYAYSSIPGLRALARLELALYQDVLSRLAAEDLNWSVTEYITDFKDSSLRLLNNTSGNEEEKILKVVWNPICSYRMVWRFQNYINKWLIKGSSSTAFISKIRRIYDVRSGPTLVDLNDAMVAINNIAHVNDLKVEDVAAGRVDGRDAGIGLRAIHCVELSRHAIATSYFYLALEWAEAALKKVINGGDTSVDLKTVELTLANAINTHDEAHGKSEGWEPTMYDRKVSGDGGPAGRRKRKTLQLNAYKRRLESNFASIRYWGLCQGRIQQSAKEKSKLFCWYETKIHHSWIIGPLKAEFLSINPKVEVVQYHDVLTDKAIANLTSIPPERFHKASVGDGLASKGSMRKESKERLAAVHWVPEILSEVSMGISKLVERATGLRVRGNHLDDLQVAGYTTGGHYVPHPDTGNYDFDRRHSRIATFMFYLSDVEKGGETVFCQAGVHATPKKGSAVFWFNLLSSGDVDDFTWHGACPVIFGEKWVANKWIHYVQQHHLHCHRERYQRYEVLVNGEPKYTTAH